MKRKRKTYYVGLKKDTNRVYICTSMECIAGHLGMCAKTISRHYSYKGVYNTEEYTIWYDVEIEVIKRGFGM